MDDLWLVSELHAIRETLFMLNCFPCSLYEVGRRTLLEGKDPYVVWIDTHRLTKKFALRHTSRECFISTLNWFAERGTAINRIREFVKRKEDVPSRQSFLAALAGSLNMLNIILVELESEYVTTEGKAQVVSLLQLQQSLEHKLRPYMTLSSIVIALSKSTFISSTHSSEHLDLLFDSACRLQSIGDIGSFEFIAKIFFQCLQTYLRPIRQWMEHGEVHIHDTTFFVRTSKDDDDDNSTVTGEPTLSTLWHDQYTLLTDEQESLKAPRFLLSAANTIFITGKSVVFLKRLMDYEIPSDRTNDLELDFTTLYPTGRSNDNSLALFDELFSSAFSEWTRKKHHSVSTRLRDVLLTNCGLWNTLSAMEHIYFGADGAQLSALATAIFEKLDNASGRTSTEKAGSEKRARGGRVRRNKDNLWNDRFVLTELVQSVFHGREFVDAKRLGVRRVAVPGVLPNTNTYECKDKARSVRQLAGIAIEYALPWPLLNILRPSSMQVYKDVFTLLLQLRRGKYSIEQLQLRDRNILEGKRSARKGRGTLVEQLYFHLRHRMLWFVNLVTMYVTIHVLKPRMEMLAEKMPQARDVDEMVKVHDRFVENVAEQALLSDRVSSSSTSGFHSVSSNKFMGEFDRLMTRQMSKFHNAILSLLDICIDFTDSHTRYLFSLITLSTADPQASAGNQRLRRPYDSDSDHDLDHHGGVPLSPTSPARPPPLSSRLMPPPPPPPPAHRRPHKRPRRYSTAPSIPSSSSEGEDTETLVGESDTDLESILGGFDGKGKPSKPTTIEELEKQHVARLRELKVEWDEWMLTLRNGLRGVSRAGVLPHLEILAEGLEGAGEGEVGMGFHVGMGIAEWVDFS